MAAIDSAPRIEERKSNFGRAQETVAKREKIEPEISNGKGADLEISRARRKPSLVRKYFYV